MKKVNYEHLWVYAILLLVIGLIAYIFLTDPTEIRVIKVYVPLTILAFLFYFSWNKIKNKPNYYIPFIILFVLSWLITNQMLAENWAYAAFIVISIVTGVLIWRL